MHRSLRQGAWPGSEGPLPWIDWAWLVAALGTVAFWTVVVVLISNVL